MLHKALSALADLQAQIVGISQSLREEDVADKKRRVEPDTVEHPAEAASLRKQIDELKERLDAAQKRNTELEGIVSSQANRIRELEAEKNERKAAPATAVQRAVEVLTNGLTRDEGRWLADLGTALHAGYDPLGDPLVDCKFDEICAEQDLADAFEQRGQVPPVRIQRRGILLFPMAIWAARLARQQYESERSGGVVARGGGGFGKRLPLADEEYLRKLSGAQKRDLERCVLGLIDGERCL